MLPRSIEYTSLAKQGKQTMVSDVLRFPQLAVVVERMSLTVYSFILINPYTRQIDMKNNLLVLKQLY